MSKEDTSHNSQADSHPSPDGNRQADETVNMPPRKNGGEDSTASRNREQLERLIRESDPLNPESGRATAVRPIYDDDLPNTSESFSCEEMESMPPSGISVRKTDASRRMGRVVLVSILTLISRILGLLRDRLMAVIFGAGAAFDAFILAFTIPNLFRRLFGEGALSAAFVPIFVGQLESGEPKNAMKTAGVLLTKLALWLGVIVCVGEIIAGGLILVLGNGSSRLILTLLMITLPYALLINLAALMAGILNSYRHFLSPALAPIILNATLIAVLLFFRSDIPAVSGETIARYLAWAVLAGGVMQLIVQIPPAWFNGFRFKPSMDKTNPGYSEVMRNFIPVAAGAAVFQINTLADRLMAEFLVPGDGAVSILFLANRLVQLPLALVTVALATVALPEFSSYLARGEKTKFAKNLLAVLRQNLFLIIPAAAMLIVSGMPIAALLFMNGTIDSESEQVLSERHAPYRVYYRVQPDASNRPRYVTLDGKPMAKKDYVPPAEVRPRMLSAWQYPSTRRTPFERIGIATAFYGIGLVFVAIGAILARAFYAMKDTKTPMRVALAGVAVNLILNLAFVNIPSLGESGLAVSSSISAAFQVALLAVILIRRMGGMDMSLFKEWAAYFGGGSLVVALIAFNVYRRMSVNENLRGFIAFIVAVILFAGIMSSILNWWYNKHTGGDSEQAGAQLKFLATVYILVMMGVITAMVIREIQASLPEGPTFALRTQFCLAPLLFGALAWLFGASNFALEEYASLKSAIFGRLIRKKKNRAHLQKPSGGQTSPG